MNIRTYVFIYLFVYLCKYVCMYEYMYCVCIVYRAILLILKIYYTVIYTCA